MTAKVHIKSDPDSHCEIIVMSKDKFQDEATVVQVLKPSEGTILTLWDTKSLAIYEGNPISNG